MTGHVQRSRYDWLTRGRQNSNKNPKQISPALKYQVTWAKGNRDCAQIYDWLMRDRQNRNKTPRQT